MLRPATPLSILLFISFILLLISVISTPIIRGIPVARFQNYNFGVFGYCQDNGPCSGIKIGYTADGLFSEEDIDFNLPSSARHSLSSLLIVHPVAALCNLIVLVLAIVAHFHSPSHSARYLLGLLILLLPTLLVTLLAFLVDILLFVPHVQWGGWIVLASTILITASGVVTCAMRRTLVSRKARKRRIAENAEMSGENFYNRQEQEAKIVPVPTMSTESKVPLVNGSPGADKLPAFATYDTPRHNEFQANPEHPPLSDGTTMVAASPLDGTSRYYGPSSRSNSRPRPGDAGIPLAAMNARGPEGSQTLPPDRRGPGPYPSNAYAGRAGYGPPRGRGGPPRGGFALRGGHDPTGPSRQSYGRGGFNPEMRGGYGARGRAGFPGGPLAASAGGGAMMAGGIGPCGPPPPIYPPQNGEISPEHYGSRQGFPPGSRQSPSPYSRGQQPNFEPVSPSQYTAIDGNPTTYVAYNQEARSPVKEGSIHSRGKSPSGIRRSPSPPPEMPLIGQAVEMNEINGRMQTYEQDAPGMGAQQHQHNTENNQRVEPLEYIPPRAQWNDLNNEKPALIHQATTMNDTADNRPRRSSNASSSYYEDVDPRFAEHADTVPPLPQGNINVQQALQHSQHNFQNSNPVPGHAPLPHTASYEELPIGARSPAESETSHFTSVSQRGINPNWRPGHGGEFNNFGPRRPQQAKTDMLLANNPDFELVPPPARFGGRGSRGACRGGPMGNMSGGRMPPPPPSALANNNDSPYPGPTTMREI